MSDFDELRRGRFAADGARKAAEQEAAEGAPRDAGRRSASGGRSNYERLSRGSFRPDARTKAAEQEARERADGARGRRRGAAARPGSGGREARTMRGRSDHVVMRRGSQGEADERAAAGGAVISRRSGVGTWLRRWWREGRTEEARQQRKMERALRRERRQQRTGGGGRRVLAGVLVALVALYLVLLWPIDRAISFSREEAQGLSSELSWHVPGLPYYVLALGSDAREGEETSRTDTMILVRVDPIGGKLTMLSIPRDTMVEIEGYGTQKINAAYTFGGVAGAVQAVSQLTGAPISHAAVIRFDGIETLVDHLGGVTVDVPVPVNDPEYTGLVLPAGPQEMDGHTALLFSRVRHGFDLGDYQRQKDQRILIEAIMRKALSRSPLEMPGMVGSMGGLLGTSMRMYSIMPLMLRFALPGGVTTYQATVPSETAMIDGVSYVVADEQALSEMMSLIDAGGDPATLA